MRDPMPEDGDTIDEIDEGMWERAERERGEEPAPDSRDPDSPAWPF